MFMSTTTKNEKCGAIGLLCRALCQIVGCYANQSDAAQVQNLSIAKGQICGIVVKLF